MSNERPKLIQDPAIAKEFQLHYDDFIDRQLPSSLIPEIEAYAEEAADTSVLAASVKTHIAFEMQSPGLDENDTKKRAIQNAGYAARAVVDLHTFLQDDAAANEPVIYATQNHKYPRDVPDFLDVHFTVANGTELEVFTRNARHEAAYFVEPKVKYGVDSPLIAHGTVMDTRLQGNEQYDPNDPHLRRGMMRSIILDYPDISSCSIWPGSYWLPVFTHGSENVMELYSRIIDIDYMEGFTKHRNQHASFLLLRQAAFMGHTLAEKFYDTADKTGLLPVWQKQLADDYALEAVSTLTNLQKNKVSIAHFVENNLGLIFNNNALDVRTLSVTLEVIRTRARVHAAQRKLGVSNSDIDQIVDALTGNTT